MIRDKITSLIKKAILVVQKEKKLPKFKIPEVLIEHPEDRSHGDYATNIAMMIAKQAKKNPLEIAEIINNQLLRINEKLKLFEKIEMAEPGFINFFLSKEHLQEELKEILKQEEKFGRLDVGKNKKVQVEFISANPTGPLTVGNARGGPFGDVLANVLEKAGFKVEKAYYINDYGMQILALGHSVLKDDEAKYKGKYIDELAKRIKEKDAYRVGQKAAKIIINEMIRKTTERMGIKYDEWFSENSLHRSSEVDKVLEFLKKKRLLYEKEGAVWFRTSKYDDERDRVVVKADDWKTYLAGDIAYHRYKFEKKKFDKVIDIWGADHYGDVPGLMAGVEALGHKGKLKIILHQFITLFEKREKLKMSKRKGIYVTMDELLREVGPDVMRFFFLQKSVDTHLHFDLDLAREQSEKNPVYYIQYAHARICSILRKIPNPKSQIPNKSQAPNPKLNLLNHLSELNLIKQLMRFPEVIEDTAQDYQVQRLPQYARDLATAFHQFYRDCQVLSDSKELAKTRMALILATKIVLKNVLDLMGISSPEKM